MFYKRKAHFCAVHYLAKMHFHSASESNNNQKELIKINKIQLFCSIKYNKITWGKISCSDKLQKQSPNHHQLPYSHSHSVISITTIFVGKMPFIFMRLQFLPTVFHSIFISYQIKYICLLFLFYLFSFPFFFCSPNALRICMVCYIARFRVN